MGPATVTTAAQPLQLCKREEAVERGDSGLGALPGIARHKGLTSHIHIEAQAFIVDQPMSVQQRQRQLQRQLQRQQHH